jgi:hypothetical protein
MGNRKHKSAGLFTPCLQQLPWLLEDHAPTQVNPKAPFALWAPDNSSPLVCCSTGIPQLATQYQDSIATHASELQASHFAILLMPAGFPPYRTQRSSTNHQALPWKIPHCPIKEQEPSSSNEW